MLKKRTIFSKHNKRGGFSLRVKRSIQVEGAFGVIKEDHGFRQFLTRGKKNVKILTYRKVIWILEPV